MSERRIAVTGGRDFDDLDLIFKVLDKFLKKGPFVLVHGGCSGGDQLAHVWAVDRGVEIEVHKADWDQRGKAAGPIRNREMARSKLSGCIAFPGGRGTKNMIKCCEEEGVPVYVVGVQD